MSSTRNEAAADRIQAAIQATLIARTRDVVTSLLAATEPVCEAAYAAHLSAIQRAIPEAFADQAALETFLAASGYGSLGDLVAYGTRWHHVPYRITEQITRGMVQGGFRAFVRKALQAKPESSRLLAIVAALVATSELEAFLNGLSETEFADVIVAAFDRRTLHSLTCLCGSRAAAVGYALEYAREEPLGLAKLVHLQQKAAGPAS